MATDRQIEANRRNAARSTGPKTDQGKARSRANATRHGLAGESAELVEAASAEFQERRALWLADRKPVGQAAAWALDRAVAASLRIERCERAVDELAEATRRRARLAWDQDRAVEAATILARIAVDPVLVSRQLQTTVAGAILLVDAWLGLLAALQAGSDWSEAEASKALDLLGVAADLRSGPTPIDDPEEGDPVAYRRMVAKEEVDRLEELARESLIPLDAMDRDRAMAGDCALLSPPAKLLLRYERDAWRRYRESIRQVDAPTAAVVPPAPAPAPAPTPAVAAKPRSPQPTPSTSFEEERRALLAEAAPLLSEVADPLLSIGDADESAWLDELERRFEARGASEASAARRNEPDSRGS